MANEVKFRLSVDGAAQVSGELDKVAGGLQRTASSTERLSGALQRVGHYGAGLLALGGVGQAAGAIAGLADEVATLNGKLRSVTDGQQQFATAQRAVVEIAERQRKGLTEIGTLYASATAAASELGASQQQVARFTEGVAASLTLNGTSAQAAAGALLQLSQAVGGSVVQAQEFNSLIDGARPLLVAAAKHIDATGGSVSRLKELVNEGKLSSKEFFQAIVAGSDELTAAAAKMPVTVGQSLTLLRNQWLQLIGAFDAGVGASNLVASSIGAVANNLGLLATVAGGAAALGVGRLTQSVASSAAAMLAERGARVAALAATVRQTEAVAIHTGFVLADARATLAHATGLGASVVAQNAVTAASARHTAALVAQTAAHTALARASSVSAIATGLLGGPVGMVVTALGLGAVAWSAWAASAERGNEDAAGSTERSTEQIVRDLNQQAEKLEALNRLRQQPGGASVAAAAGDDAVRLAQLGDKITELMNRTGQAANLNETARQAILQATLKQYAELDGAIRRVAQADADKGALSLDAQKAEYLKRYATNAERLSAALRKASEDFKGVIPPDIESRIRASFAKPARDGSEAFADLTREIGKTIAVQQLRAAAGGEITRAQQLEIDLNARLGSVLDQLRPAQRSHVQSLIAQAVAGQGAADAAEAHANAAGKLERARRDEANVGEQTLDRLERETQALRDRYVELTAGAEALDALVNLRLEDAAAAHEEKAALLALFDAGADVVAQYRAMAVKLREQIALRKGIAAATANKEAERANVQAAEGAAAEWKKAADQIDSALTDALMRGFENGKGFADNLRDAVVNMFKTMVLRPVVSAIVQPVAGSVTGALLGTQPRAGGLQQGANTLQVGGALNSAYGAVAQYYTGAAAGASSASLAYANAVGAMGGDSLGALYAANGGWAGVSAGAAGGTGAGAAGGAAAGSGSSAIGAAGWAAIVVAAVLRGMSDHDKGFNRDAAKETGTAAGDASYRTSVIFSKLGFSDKWADLLGGSVAIGAILGMSSKVRTDATGVRGTLGAGDFTGEMFADRVRKGGLFRSDDRWTDTAAISTDLEKFFDTAAAGVQGKAKEYGQALGLPTEQLAGITKDIRVGLTDNAEDNQRAITEALAGYGDALVASYEDALAPLKNYGETVTQTIERVAGALLGVNDVLDLIGVTALDKSVAGGKTAVELSNFFGGMQGLQSASQSYYQQFFSDEERRTTGLRRLGDALAEVGIELPGTREAFRAVVEGLDLTTQAGQSQFSAMLALSGAFADLVPATEAAAAAVRSAADIAAERAGIERRLLQAQGDTAALRARERDALDASNRPLLDRIFALEDEQARLSERASLEARLWQLQGNTAALRARERDALDASNRALYDQITALEDAQQATQAMQQALQAFDAVAGTFAAGVGSAFGDLRSQIEAEIGRVEGAAADRVSALDRQAEQVRDTFERLADAMADLRASLAETIADITGELAGDGGRGAARAQLDAMLAAARAGQQLDPEAVRRAVGTAARLSTDAFGDRASYLRDAARLQGTLRDLSAQAGLQTAAASADMTAELGTIAQEAEATKASAAQQVAALREQLAHARSAAEALVRIDDGVQTVAGALAALTDAIAATRLAAGEGGPSGRWLRSGDSEVYGDARGAVGVRKFGAEGLDGISVKGRQSGFSAQQAVDWISARVAAGDAQAVYDRARAEGLSLSTLDALMAGQGWQPGTAEAWAKANGLPTFAAGGAHAGGLRLVGERGPELEATGPARIHSFDQLMTLMGGGARDDALVAEVKALRAELARMRADNNAQQLAIAEHTSKTASVMRRWEGDGMPPERT